VAVAGTAPLCAGKCHASALVGRRLLLFAGSMHTCGEVAWLDLEQLSWGRCAPSALRSQRRRHIVLAAGRAAGGRACAVERLLSEWGSGRVLSWLPCGAGTCRPRAVAGPPPCERMSATAVLGGGGDVLVFGG
jgi:hypothetical protein